MWNSPLSAISCISGSFSMILSLFQPSKGKYIYMKIDAQNVVALVVDMHSDLKNKYVYTFMSGDD